MNQWGSVAWTEKFAALVAMANGVVCQESQLREIPQFKTIRRVLP
jgi:hypothetical protein